MSQWDKDYNQYIKNNTAATNKKIEQRAAGLNQIVDDGFEVNEYINSAK